MFNISKSLPLIHEAQNNHRAKHILLESGLKTWTDDEECFGLEVECVLPAGTEFTRVKLWGDIGVPLKRSNRYIINDGRKDELMVIIGLTVEANGLVFEDVLIYTGLNNINSSLPFPLMIQNSPTDVSKQMILKAVTDCGLNSPKSELFVLVAKLNYCFKLLTSADI